MNKYNFLSAIIIVFFIASCSTSTSRYQQHKDSIPTRVPNASELKDATPRAESHSRGGNKPYQVWGKHYKVLPSAKGYVKQGTASWYGEKFHGHLTSNGEIYDMYAMSAAHKSLPLPSYVRVTNTANNKSVIVRVNDRGPFHQSRLIDLSYSAAYKLDMLKTGTANVKIVALTDFTPPTTLVTPATRSMKENRPAVVTQNTTADSVIKPTELTKTSALSYIQVFATSKKEIAQTTIKNIESAITEIHQPASHYPITAPLSNQVYKVVIGPINNSKELDQLLLKLKENGYPNAFRKNI
jgi:rare lipoprotein A